MARTDGLSSSLPLKKLIGAGRIGKRILPEFGEVSEDEGIESNWIGLVQWTSNDGSVFFPAGKTAASLSPGIYDICHRPTLCFRRATENCETLIKFPETVSDKVVAEIEKFWQKEDDFKKYQLSFKRGILLYGPPGGGKTCTVRLIMKDVIQRDGIVVRFNESTFESGISIFRTIQPNTPVVVVIEDIDQVIHDAGEPCVANILDGICGTRKCVFLATTNYPERLNARILNRPSRFDKRFKVDVPNEESRLLYLKSISKGATADVAKWAKDTNHLSFAHLRELFVAVVILENDYDETLKRLRDMGSKLDSSEDGGKMGLCNDPRSGECFPREKEYEDGAR